MNPTPPPWLSYFETPEMQKEIREQIVYFLISHGGYLRKKIPYQDQILYGTILDPPIWKLICPKVTLAGIYSLSLTHSLDFSYVPENPWEMGDHILAYWSWKYLKGKYQKAPEFLEQSILVQWLEYPYIVKFSSPESWVDFLDGPGGIFMLYGEEKIVSRWKEYTLQIWNTQPLQAYWLFQKTISLISRLWEIFQDEREYLLSFLFFLKEIFRHEGDYKKFLQSFPILEETNFPFEKVKENLFFLERIWSALEYKRSQILPKHYLDQRVSEKIFLEKYNRFQSAMEKQISEPLRE